VEEVIFEVMGEGGGVKLVGRRRPGGEGWEYRRVAREMSYADYGEEGEAHATTVPALPEEPVWVSTWSEALALMDRNPWAELHPRSVHPEFREEVLVEATRRLMEEPGVHSNRAISRWLKVCGV
jgi:hypothetical protein